MPATPRSGAKATPNSASLSTPYSSNSHKSHDSIPRSQRSLQEVMKAELYHATFESDTFLDTRYPADSIAVDHVVAALHDAKISYDHLQYADGDDHHRMKPWPNTSAEKDHYKPYAWFINKILSLSSEKIPMSFHKHLCFSVYDRTVLEGADMDSPLKPDIVGCHRKLRNDEKVSWKDVEVFVEVKNRWPEMISQASTYARCCLAFQQNRDFITAIHINHARQEMRLGVYGRFGLVATKACILSTQDGFVDFVKAIVGIYSLSNAHSAGIDASRTNTQFRLPHGKLYSISKVLCDRRCVRGRATRVYTVDIEEDQMQPADSKPPANRKPPATPEFVPLLKHARHNRYPIRSLQHRCSPHPTDALTSSVGRMSLQESGSVGEQPVPPDLALRYSSSATEEPDPFLGSSQPAAFPRSQTLHEWDRDIEPACESENGCSPPCDDNLWSVDAGYPLVGVSVPSLVVLKDSWPVESHADEGHMFRSLGDGFGLPKVLCSYRVTNADRPLGSTAELIPDDAVYWDVYKVGGDAEVKPERRIHKRILLETEGTSLLDAPNPRCLVEGIVHAMLGHYVMFKEGWLHRDVSVGNIMLMHAENRNPVKDFPITKELTKCIGFISDGDQAIRWEDNQRDLTARRSGTLPFMSCDLIYAWSTDTQGLHTAIDDLESFVWVLLWTVLSILESKGVLKDAHEQDLLFTMRSHKLFELRNREGILGRLQKLDTRQQFSEAFGPFGHLLIQWLEIARRSALKVPRSPAPLFKKYCTDTYEEYIEAGLQYLSKLPESWEYLTEDG